MTTRDIVLALVANAIFLFFFQPLLKRLRTRVFEWVLAGNSRLMTAYFTKVARRDTSYVVMLISLLWVLAALGFSAVKALMSVELASVGLRSTESPLDLLLLVLGTYGFITFLASSLMLTMVQQALRIYDTIRTQVRPDVDEEFLTELDSRFSSFRSKADFDAVVAALKNGHVTHPRSPANTR